MATVRERSRAAVAYDADFYTWLNEQAQLLRSGRLDELDVGNIAEELEGMARSEFRSLVSSLRVLVMHMLKWDQQPEHRTLSWVYSIREHRDRYAEILEENPGLKPRRDEALAKAYKLARNWAAHETRLPEEEFPKTCPYDWDDLLNRPFETDSAPDRR